MKFMRLLACLLLLSWTLQAQSSSSFRVDATYVRVPVTVLDSDGRTLANLSREHFRLLDEGQPRAIENFLLDQTAIHVVLLLDSSASVRQELQEIRQAALRFARAFDSGDRIAVISFSNQIEVLQDWTNDPKKLKNSLKNLDVGYRTALYDALLETAREKLTRVAGRKAIILLTDGLDNHSSASFSDVVNSLIDSDISLYIVSRTRLAQAQLHGSDRVAFLNRIMKNVLDEEKDFVDIYFRKKETSLSHLARSTGGRAFFPERLGDLTKSYDQVARELKNQYLLTFRPPAHSSTSLRTIRVVCTRKLAKIYHRSRYRWRAPAGP